MAEVEFFVTEPGVFTSEIHYQVGDEVRRLEEAPDRMIAAMMNKIEDRFPRAAQAIKAMGYCTDREVVAKFVRCNFGRMNHIPDIDETGKYNFEKVKCDCRKKCPAHGVVCQLT
jgi:hypothetical protein